MPDYSKHILIGSFERLDRNGFVLNHHANGGKAVILAYHTESCRRHSCTCGAVEAMPESVVNCQITWPKEEE